MEDKIENTFRELIASLQVARLYPQWHPQFKMAVEKAHAALTDALKDRQELVIGIVGEEIAFEKEIFFSLSAMSKPMIAYLKERGIEKIAFYQGIQSEELSKFVAFLTTPKDEIQQQLQEEFSLPGIKNIAVGKIKVSGSSVIKEKAMEAINYLSVYENSLDKVTHAAEALLNQEEISPLALRFTMADIMENLLGRHQDFLNLAAVKRYDVRTFIHILNVSILSMFFSSRLGFDKEEIIDMGIAGLFHDIGKLYISKKIIQKPEKLTEEEFSAMKSHVIIGAEVLLKYADGLGILPAVVSFEHHLKYNQTGYPKLSFSVKPHIASLIVCICDVYDALSQRRGYKRDYPPEMIYELMLKEKGTTFDPELLEEFFKVTGVWPVGTIVSLSDARVAVVREENEDDIFSPKVEIIIPKEQKEIIDLRLLKERLKIERSLNPLTEGKAYLPLI